MVKIKIGVSSCLLGERVRYNGGHKYSQVVIDLLGERFEAVPVCPEVEMGVPREPVQLVAGGECIVGDSSNSTQKLPPGISKLPPRVVVVGVESGKDWTEALNNFNSRQLKELTNLSGFIFKSRSPSCGTQAVPVHKETNGATSAGLFALAFMQHFPRVPVIDEEQLQDKQARENFIVCVEKYGGSLNQAG